MVASHLFQDFGTIKESRVGKRSMTAEEIEDLKLQAFESGYQAGWDDAVKAQSESLTHVSSEFAASLQSASFEYHELRATMNASIQTIMAEVVDAILPKVAHASLGAHIREYITSVARNTLEMPIEISVAPSCEDALRATLTGEVPEPFTLVLDPSMSPNQVTLRLGASEAEIDLDKTVADISSAVTAYFDTQKAEVTDGRSA